MNSDDKQVTKQHKPSSRELESAIGETRNSISGDIKALSDKVSSANLKEEAKNALNDATDAAVGKVVELKDAAIHKAVEIKDVAVDTAVAVKDAALEKATEVKDTAVETAQRAADIAADAFDELSVQTGRASKVAWSFTTDNAVPLTLIGIGAGWLIANRRGVSRIGPGRIAQRSDRGTHKSVASASRDGRSTRETKDAHGSATFQGNGASGVKRRRNETSGQSLHLAETVGHASAEIGQLGTNVASGAQALYEKAGATLGDAQHTLAEGAARGRDVVQQQLRRARTVSRDFAEQNPFALALGTLVAGIGVGLLLPSTARRL
jgi:hypothetical protein